MYEREFNLPRVTHTEAYTTMIAKQCRDGSLLRTNCKELFVGAKRQKGSYTPLHATPPRFCILSYWYVVLQKRPHSKWKVSQRIENLLLLYINIDSLFKWEFLFTPLPVGLSVKPWFLGDVSLSLFSVPLLVVTI
jgi:hypothetical protein